MPNTIIADGTLAFGSLVLSVTNPTGTAFNVIADNITTNHPTKKVTRTNELDIPVAQRTYSGVLNGTAQCQIPGTEIRVGATFAEDLLGLGSDQNWYITEVSKAYQKDGETKCNISFDNRLSNSAPTVTEA